MSAETEKGRADIVKLSGQGASAVMGRIDIVTAGSTPGGDDDEGTLSITENGTYDVQDYAEAEVNVPVGVFPTGTKNITENGTHDVAEFASASVNVPTVDLKPKAVTIQVQNSHPHLIVKRILRRNENGSTIYDSGNQVTHYIPKHTDAPIWDECILVWLETYKDDPEFVVTATSTDEYATVGISEITRQETSTIRRCFYGLYYSGAGLSNGHITLSIARAT